MTGMRRGSLLGFVAIMAALYSGCEGDGSTVTEGASGSGGSGGGAGTLNLGTGAAGAPDTASGGGAADPDPGPGIEECETFAGLDECGVTSVEASYSAANVLLVIDKSGSMDDQPEGFETKKWDALKAALGPALAAVAEEMSFGLLLYPFSETEEIALDCLDNCCEVPAAAAAIRVGMGPGTETAFDVVEALNDTAPGGGTPTAAALAAALEYFVNGDGKDLQGDRFVLLATDGGPNCGGGDNTCDADRCTPNLDGACPPAAGNCCDGEPSYCLDDVAVVEQIEALAEAGVPTFVVGIPGTEQYASYLDTFATAGTVPNADSPPDYYAVSAEGGVAGLTQTFIDITTHLVRSCEVDIGMNAVDKRLVNVAVDCEIVPFEDGAGWDIAPDAPETLVLAGEVCDQVKRQGARRVDVVYGCPTIK